MAGAHVFNSGGPDVGAIAYESPGGLRTAARHVPSQVPIPPMPMDSPKGRARPYAIHIFRMKFPGPVPRPRAADYVYSLPRSFAFLPSSIIILKVTASSNLRRSSPITRCTLSSRYTKVLR